MGLRDEEVDAREGNALEERDIGDGERNDGTRKCR